MTGPRRDSQGRTIARDADTGSTVRIDTAGIERVQAVAVTAAEKAVDLVVQRVTASAARLVGVKNWRESGPSRPGQPPALRTGTLRGSIREAADTYIEGDDFVGIVGSTVDYAAALELGSDARGLEPRPFLRPALDENADRIRGILADQFAQAFKVRGGSS